MATYVEIDDTEVAPESPVTSSLMTRLRDNALAYLGAPTGTRGIYPQELAPLGWAIVLGIDDRALKISATEGGDTTGNVAFSTLFARTTVDGHTLTDAEMPEHVHGIDDDTRDANSTHTHAVLRYNSLSNIVYGGGGGGGALNNIWTSTTSVASNTESGTHDHDFVAFTQAAGGDNEHSHGLDLRVQYLGAHVADKD